MRINPIADRRHGAMLVLIAVCLPLCLIMAAFAVDVAWMQLVRTELRAATDAASRAGAKELSITQDEEEAREKAQETALRNRVASEGLVLRDSDVEFGISEQTNDTSRFRFVPGGETPNAMRVTGDRTSGSASGAVDLLFAGVLGVREFEPRQVATATILDRDVCLVVDRSGSMTQKAKKGKKKKKKQKGKKKKKKGKKGKGKGGLNCDPPSSNSRWAALDVAVQVFLSELRETRSDEHVALVSYASEGTICNTFFTTSTIESDLVSDYSPIANAMSRLGSNPLRGRTNIGAGLRDGIRVLTGPSRRRLAAHTIILLTDGLQNEGTPAVDVARQAASEKIVVHTITFSSAADQSGMQAVAAATGGKHFHAPDAEELVRIFREIARTLPVLQTQ